MKKLLLASIGIGTTAAFLYYKKKKYRTAITEFLHTQPINWKPPARKTVIRNMNSRHYDLLIIGGGSSGAGCALEAVSRGLKVALVEESDFASGTSSKSTNLLHGGIRYLQQAVDNLDLKELQFVQEGLKERLNVINMAPYISDKIRIVIPAYSSLFLPYMWIGLKMYDWISGKKSLGPSNLIARQELIRDFPGIKTGSLKGAVGYFDGVFNDARLNLMTILTSVFYGADCLNYVKFEDFKKSNGQIVGGVCTDKISGDSIEIFAKGVISSIGPLTDKIRKKDMKVSEDIMTVSSGAHIVLDQSWGPHKFGFVNPKTKDGRILFFLPWQRHLLVGSTDNKCEPVLNPKPYMEELNFIFDEFKKYIANPHKLTKKAILSTWRGIRPLVKDPNHKDTSRLLRTHHIEVTKSNLLILTGGKWTIFRKMAEDAINRAVDVFHLAPKRPSISRHIKLLGADRPKYDVLHELKLDSTRPDSYINHLYTHYGSRALNIKEQYTRISSNHPYSLEEIEYQLENEMAVKVDDVLTRRLRFSCVDVIEAYNSLDKVIDVFKNKFKWSKAEALREKQDAIESLKERGLDVILKLRESKA